MPLSPTDQLHLNTSAGFLQIGEPMDAWNELEMITPLNRAKTEVLTVRLAVCRALKDWEQAEEIARTLIRREPQNVMHVVALAEVMGKREGPAAAAAVYEFAVERFPDFGSGPPGAGPKRAKPTCQILVRFADFPCISVPLHSAACREVLKARNPHKH